VDHWVEVIGRGTTNDKVGECEENLGLVIYMRERVRERGRRVLVGRIGGGGNFLSWRDAKTRKLGGPSFLDNVLHFPSFPTMQMSHQLEFVCLLQLDQSFLPP
jgi:hypothetical protein